MSARPPAPPLLVPPRPKRSKTRAVLVVVAIVIVGAILLAFAGKGMYHNYRLSMAAVEKFHRQLRQGDSDAIWEDSTDAFRGKVSRADMNKLIATVRDKMGVPGSTKSTGFHANWQAGSVNVKHVLDTDFSNGRAQETFVWVVVQGEPRLYSYYIDSPRLR